MTEQIVVSKALKEVCCDGGGNYGHPKVFLHFGDADCLACPYCSRQFIKG